MPLDSPYSVSGPFSSPEGWSRRGYLPHYESSQVYQSVTFRLGDSLPSEALAKIQADAEDDADRRRRIEEFIDAGHGACHFRRPELATIVESRLLHDDGVRYRLCAWCIMPNHLHVLLHTLPGNSLGDIVHAWKSVSARLMKAHAINPTGFWQRDYWDRFIRDERHFHSCAEYIRNNPVKAGLVQRPEDWRWGDAWWRNQAERHGDAGG